MAHIYIKIPRILITLLIIPLSAHTQDICTPDNVLITSLQNSNPGSTLNLSMTNPTLNLVSCPELKIQNDSTNWHGGLLLLSDSPEYPSTRGKLYEDGNLPPTTEPNPNRIFIYHVNGRKEGSIKFSILITNLHPTQNAVLKRIKSGVAGPTKSYLQAGKLAFYRWLNSISDFEILVQPFETVQLDNSYFEFDVQPDQLLHGIYDYTMTQSHKVTLCSLEDGDDPVGDCLRAEVLPRDGHIRGTFLNSDKYLNINEILEGSSENVVEQFPLADGQVDGFISGVDSTDGTEQVNAGNYGVLYKIKANISSVKVESESEGLFNVAFLVNPRGGFWAGAVGVYKDGEEEEMEVVLLPEGENSIVRNNWEGSLIGRFGYGVNPTILWMPTGGSSLPVSIASVKYLSAESGSGYFGKIYDIIFAFI